jgi:hypothetical protein
LHPAPRRSRPIAEPLDTPASQRCGKAIDETRDDANDIPQQRVVGRMMNVGLHHRGVDTQLLSVLQTDPTAACTTRSLIALSVFGVSRLKPRWNASCRGPGKQ